jgi:hypothetical protein
MQSGKLAKAARGELVVQLPIGYVRRSSGEVMFDPDEQAQQVVRLVFATFGRLGTLNSVLRYFAGHQIQLRSRQTCSSTMWQPALTPHARCAAT